MGLPIPTPNVALVDPQTGLMAPKWYDYFKSKDRGVAQANGGTNTSAWYYGTSAPANTLGLNDDFYIQTQGTSVVAFYVKKNGVWT